jgi:hypothetical protein
MQTHGVQTNECKLFDMQTNGTINTHYYAN